MLSPMKLTLATALASTTSALLVAPSSPCSQYCGNVLSSTTGADIVCDDGSFSGSSAGTVFETCIDCELTSTYSSGNQSDLQYLIYNLRYALSYCLAGLPNNTDFQVSPCTTSTACSPLDTAFYWDNLTTQDDTYSFCNGWIEIQVPKCTACLKAGTTRYLMNYVTVLDAACSQLPSVGSTVSVDGTPFSTVPMNVTTPSQTPLYTYTPAHSAISLGGKVGIAIGGLAFILSIAGFTIVCLGRRRRRAYLKSLETRYGHSGWPSPSAGHPGQDMFETPTSQKPLRSWDDNSPMTASSDNNLFPRYFSPYSSQYNSPVSAADIKTHAWPAEASRSASQTVGGIEPIFSPGLGSDSDTNVGGSRNREASTTNATKAPEHEVLDIGLALGGSDSSPSRPPEASYQKTVAEEPSLKSVASDQKGKGYEMSNESYELREIDSNGAPRVGASSQAPILQHPGYGRGYPFFPPPPKSSI